MNVRRRNEPVATDSFYAQDAAIDSPGFKIGQFFVGRYSLLIDVYGMSNTDQFVNTLEDNIRERGAMDKLIADDAKVEQSSRVVDILCAYAIQSWTSEPGYQHQNFAEHRYGHWKRNHQWFTNLRNVPGYAWLLLGQWIADVMNHTAERSLGWKTPMEVYTGQTPDISKFMLFMFWDVVYCARLKSKTYTGLIGSTESNEIRG